MWSKLGDVKPNVVWAGLIDTFMVEGVGEHKVVRKAEGLALWGSTIKVELHESNPVIKLLGQKSLVPHQTGPPFHPFNK